MDYKKITARRTERMGNEAIRNILKVVDQPGMVSLAGGIPAPESFPMEILGELCEEVLEKYGVSAFQYGLTEGFIPLREVLADFVRDSRGFEVTKDDIFIASGSQSVLDVLAKILINKGDKIAVEAPTYFGAVQAFDPYEPEYVSLEADKDGLKPESLEKALEEHDIKFVYLVPTFQNPTGRTLTMDRRKHVAEIIKKHEVLLLEDDPYSDLRFGGNPVPPIKSMAPDYVVYTSTLSKLFAPGLRVGYYIGPSFINDLMATAKQGVDLHTSSFSQALSAEYIGGGYLKKQIPKIIEVYRPKQQSMLNALKKYMPSEYSWSEPEGGMFIWVEGPDGVDMEDIYWKCIEEKVAFVPGKLFYTEDGEGLETMRLNYSKSDEKTIDKAIKTISEVLKNI